MVVALFAPLPPAGGFGRLLRPGSEPSAQGRHAQQRQQRAAGAERGPDASKVLEAFMFHRQVPSPTHAHRRDAAPASGHRSSRRSDPVLGSSSSVWASRPRCASTESRISWWLAPGRDYHLSRRRGSLRDWSQEPGEDKNRVGIRRDPAIRHRVTKPQRPVYEAGSFQRREPSVSSLTLSTL